MAASLLPNGKQYFVDPNGRPLAAGKVFFYIPNTTTPKDTWQDSGETILNTNPVALDGNGLALIYGDGIYRQIVQDKDGNLIWDQLTSSAATFADAQLAQTALQPDTGQYVVETFDDVVTTTVPANAETIMVQGRSTIGDNGDMLLVRTDTAPTNGISVTSADGSVFSYPKRTIRLSQAGAFPNDSVSQDAAISRAIAYIESLGGGCIEIDKNGAYAIGATITLANIKSTIRIENTGGGILTALSNLSTPVVSLGDPNGTAPTTAKLIADDLIIDNSQGIFSVGAASCEGLHMIYFDQVILNNYQCIGGFDPNTYNPSIPPAVGGDSGLGSIGCRAVIMNNPIISGQPDTALYPNWDNTTTIDGYFECNGGVFFNNTFCLTAKRNLAQAIIRGGHAHDNIGGFSVQQIVGPPNVDVCRYMELDGILIERTTANVAVWRDGAKGKIHDCTIRDIGYLPNGTGGVGSNAIAVYALGASGISSHNNVFEMVKWTPQGEFAYTQNNSVFNTVSYTGGDYDRKGNTYRNWSRHSGVGTLGTKGFALEEAFDSCPSSFAATRYSALFATQGDLVTYYELPDTRLKTYISGQIYTQDAGRIGDPVTVDLTSIGSLAANTTTSVQSLTVTGVTSGDEATLSRVSSTLAGTPAIIWSWRVVSNAVQYTFKNTGASPFDFTSQSIQISVRRP